MAWGHIVAILLRHFPTRLCSKISKLEGRADRDAMRLLETTRARLAACTEERETQGRLLTDRLAALERERLDWCDFASAPAAS